MFKTRLLLREKGYNKVFINHMSSTSTSTSQNKLTVNFSLPQAVEREENYCTWTCHGITYAKMHGNRILKITSPDDINKLN